MLTQLHFCAIGFGFSICANKVYMILTPRTKQSQRFVKLAKAEQRWIDASCRRPVKTLILMDDGKIIGCAFSPKTTLARIQRACGDYNSEIPPVDDDEDFEDDEYENFEDEDEEETEDA